MNRKGFLSLLSGAVVGAAMILPASAQTVTLHGAPFGLRLSLLFQSRLPLRLFLSKSLRFLGPPLRFYLGFSLLLFSASLRLFLSPSLRLGFPRLCARLLELFPLVLQRSVKAADLLPRVLELQRRRVVVGRTTGQLVPEALDFFFQLRHRISAFA